MKILIAVELCEYKTGSLMAHNVSTTQRGHCLHDMLITVQTRETGLMTERQAQLSPVHTRVTLTPLRVTLTPLLFTRRLCDSS